ncbi:tRNA (adenosine(37)-N6)-dimethylallyltransferase MiaA [Sphingomonas sp. H39-1-10]|uniref:tRNA (adenosine(37)-N6)-dimethylallyltransferase MiaA n=1 Tax=Sphingomonas TaxID=13687 RepID=UPI00088CB535|nr:MULTISPECIES: tRNA (adenosine(37)-N6)-dimethylallyltransferase MiaA [Sphingomonas]MDF0489504.1 tRNA (adenosine(37)-N6)-dimethylallyltransferase MiaA [Sphingomonas pollutisoli]SDA28971.1 tRNA dimethylallyltransferase [Sphingomonas sp. NFR15]
MTGLPKVALITGPTASGKSALALALAETRRGVVINADSAQVYRDLRVVSARPSPEEEARAPHRLFGHVDGADAGYSAARWASEARDEIDAAHAAGKLPILVGGTGLYLRTLLDGIAPVPEIDPAIRAEVRALPVAQAHARLAACDPAMAAALNPADTARVARALEVVRSTGRSIADWRAAKHGGIGHRIDLAALILLPERGWLNARIDARFAAMVRDGADEVAALLARADVPADAPVCRAIGVPEIAALLGGKLDAATAAAAGATATRHYAKRQYTWFRNQPPPSWIRTDETETSEQIVQIATLLRS